jgi:hypothetical protein
MAGSTRMSTDKTAVKEGNAVHQLRAAMEETTGRAKNSCSIALEAVQVRRAIQEVITALQNGSSQSSRCSQTASRGKNCDQR